MHILSPVTDNCCTWIGVRERCHGNDFMTNLHGRMLPDPRIETATGWIPDGRASNRATGPCLDCLIITPACNIRFLCEEWLAALTFNPTVSHRCSRASSNPTLTTRERPRSACWWPVASPRRSPAFKPSTYLTGLEWVKQSLQAVTPPPPPPTHKKTTTNIQSMHT